MTKFKKSQHCIDCLECDKNLPIFSVLTEQEQKDFNQHRFEVSFKPGETIFKQGAFAAHMCVLTSGLAKLFVEGVQSRQLIVRIIRPWELIGQAGLYFDNRHHYSVSALSEVTVCFIKIEEFKHMIQTHPRFAEEFIKICTKKGILAFDKMVSLSQKQMHGRIADGLIYLSKNIYENLAFSMHLSRQDLADLTGMSRDSAIRILKEFHNDGLIELNGRKMNILNMEQLEHISDIG